MMRNGSFYELKHKKHTGRITGKGLICSCGHYIDDFSVVNDCITKISLKQLPYFSEYIRKDALLEWAKEQLRQNASIKPDDSLHDQFLMGKENAYADLIHKLNSI